MLFPLSTLAAAVTATVSTAPVALWPLVSSETSFTVRMPGPVDEQILKVSSDLTSFDEHVFSCQGGTAFYRLSFVDLPTKVIAKRDNSDILLSAQNGARLEQSLFYAEGSGVSDGAPWRRFRVQSQKGPVISHFLMMDGNRFYHLEVVSPPQNWRKSKAKEFFESFELQKPSLPIKPIGQ